jgi:hypothetical protein
VPRPSAAVKAAADQFAANVLPIIREIGVERRNQARAGIAAAQSNARKLATARSGSWSHV